MSDEDLEREMIQAAADRMGWTINGWDHDEDGDLRANLGRFIVIEGDDDEGLYQDDEGVLFISVVGAARFGNQRAHFGFLTEYTDSPVDVRDPSYMVEPLPS
jgi:hypothetical protein